ncbi:hypothetical protein BaRGS_00016421, partial [Batillaria attramentaria]
MSGRVFSGGMQTKGGAGAPDGCGYGEYRGLCGQAGERESYCVALQGVNSIKCIRGKSRHARRSGS